MVKLKGFVMQKINDALVENDDAWEPREVAFDVLAAMVKDRETSKWSAVYSEEVGLHFVPVGSIPLTGESLRVMGGRFAMISDGLLHLGHPEAVYISVDSGGRFYVSGNPINAVDMIGRNNIVEWSENAWERYHAIVDERATALRAQLQRLELSLPFNRHDPRLANYPKRLVNALHDVGANTEQLSNALNFMGDRILEIVNGDTHLVEVKHRRASIRAYLGPSLYDEWLRKI